MTDVRTRVDPRVDMQGSISAYYYTPARNVFVGLVVSIGTALIAYHGYTRGENRTLDVAGVLAICVALFSRLDGRAATGEVGARDVGLD